MDSPDTRSRLAALLAEQSTLTLATLDPTSQPMAASLFFAADPQLNLIWTSSVNSRHSRNLAREPRAAVTVHAVTWSWRDIAGAQLEGEAHEVSPGADWQAALELYLGKFPFAKDFQAELARSSFYRFAPRWARLIDNGQGFGHKEEISL
ncbi:MAG: pyridoxamine 5'-phosphate oxidase family protein [Anaerolineales bacterium]